MIAGYVDWSHRHYDLFSVKTAKNKPSKQSKHWQYSRFAVRELLKFVTYDQPFKAHIQLHLSCNDTEFVHFMTLIDNWHLLTLIDLALSVWVELPLYISEKYGVLYTLILYSHLAMTYIVQCLIAHTRYQYLVKRWSKYVNQSPVTGISTCSYEYRAKTLTPFVCNFYSGMSLCHLYDDGEPMTFSFYLQNSTHTIERYSFWNTNYILFNNLLGCINCINNIYKIFNF